MNNSVVQCENVSMSYATNAKGASLLVLDRISLDVKQREFVSIVGPSGCGKSTLLRLIAGFERPTEGSILINGKLEKRPSSKRVVVFQQPALYPWLSVAENISFGLRLRRHSRCDVDERVDYFLDRVGLSAFRTAKPYELSGGMQQRVAIARALIVEPALVLMDEPFAALDAQMRGSMQDFLLELWQEIEAAVVFVTHDIAEAILLGDRVIVMDPHPGRIRHQETISLARPRYTSIELSDAFTTIKRHMTELKTESVA